MPTALELDSNPHATREVEGALSWPAYIFRFGEHELCAATWELRCRGERVALGGNALGLLLYLIRCRHRVVSRRELMDTMWKDTQVQDGSISQLIWQIRRSLHDSPRKPRVVRTLRGRGYRFVAHVEQAVCAGGAYDAEPGCPPTNRQDEGRSQAARLGGGYR
jgi:DNA-binding winged helix-turn-helix (wHTH) protein